MPDGLSSLLVAGTPVVEERSANDIEVVRCADHLRTVSNAHSTTGILVFLILYRDLSGHVARTREIRWREMERIQGPSKMSASPPHSQSSKSSHVRATHQLLCARPALCKLPSSVDPILALASLRFSRAIFSGERCGATVLGIPMRRTRMQQNDVY
jgi:hypothetical protein